MTLAIKSIFATPNNSVQQYYISNYKRNGSIVEFKGNVVYSEFDHFLKKLPERFVEDHCLMKYNLTKIDSIKKQISEKMKKFSESTFLSFKKKNENEYSVFIGNSNSHYVELLPDFKVSKTNNAEEDLDLFENLNKS